MSSKLNSWVGTLLVDFEASCLLPEKFIVLDFNARPDVIESFRNNENLGLETVEALFSKAKSEDLLTSTTFQKDLK